MGVLGDGSAWCFCAAGGKAERIRSGILAVKGAAVAAVSSSGAWGTGFLIHRDLLLTTHGTLPSAVAAAAATDVRLSHGRLAARLVPQRFFITSPILDLTLIGLDAVDEQQTPQGLQPHSLKPCLSPNIALGSTVFLLGHTNRKDLKIGEGRVVIATDNLIKFSTDGYTWRPGSAGFDTNGNLAFIVCDPMKIASSSPTLRYASAPTASLLEQRQDLPMQFGIPIAVILDWLHQHWNGNLEDISKPKLHVPQAKPAVNGSGHSSSKGYLASVKTIDHESENIVRPRWLQGSSSRDKPVPFYDENAFSDHRSSYENSTPGIYRTLISANQIQQNDPSPPFLHINLPPRPLAPNFPSLPLKQVLHLDSNIEASSSTIMTDKDTSDSLDNKEASTQGEYEAFSGSAYHNYFYNEVQSSSSLPAMSELGDDKEGYSSGDETMFSAETRESRNLLNPLVEKVQPAGRGKCTVNHNRWNSYGNLETPKGVLVAQPTAIPTWKGNMNDGALPLKARDYCSPTVSSSLRRNTPQQPSKTRHSFHASSKWVI